MRYLTAAPSRRSKNTPNGDTLRAASKRSVRSRNYRIRITWLLLPAVDRKNTPGGEAEGIF